MSVWLVESVCNMVVLNIAGLLESPEKVKTNENKIDAWFSVNQIWIYMGTWPGLS